MRYLIMLLMICSFAISQGKEQRFQIVMMPSEMKEFQFKHVVVPDIGTPKSIPILLDTQTGKTWVLERVPVVKESNPTVEWRWKEIKFDDPNSPLMGLR